MGPAVRFVLKLVLLGLPLAAATPGCGPNHVETDVGPLPNGVRFKFLYPTGLPVPDSSSKASSEFGYVYTWTRGSQTVGVANLNLKVNGRPFGTLNPGDIVVVDVRGDLRVTVNGA
jgi:hypothetical protein